MAMEARVTGVLTGGEAAGPSSLFFFFWGGGGSIGGNFKQGHPSWHQSWHTSSERLWSMDPGIKNTTIAPGSQGAGTITVVMVLVAEV